VSLGCLSSPRTLGGLSIEARRANGNRAGSEAAWYDPESGHELELGWRDVTETLVVMEEKRSVRGDLPILLVLNDDRWRHSSLWRRAV
jgi:hypothetical protein